MRARGSSARLGGGGRRQGGQSSAGPGGGRPNVDRQGPPWQPPTAHKTATAAQDPVSVGGLQGPVPNNWRSGVPRLHVGRGRRAARACRQQRAARTGGRSKKKKEAADRSSSRSRSGTRKGQHNQTAVFFSPLKWLRKRASCILWRAIHMRLTKSEAMRVVCGGGAGTLKSPKNLVEWCPDYWTGGAFDRPPSIAQDLGLFSDEGDTN